MLIAQKCYEYQQIIAFKIYEFHNILRYENIENSNNLCNYFREEFATQNCILTSSGAGSSTLAVPAPSSTPAHTESTALLADIRTIKINAS